MDEKKERLLPEGLDKKLLLGYWGIGLGGCLFMAVLLLASCAILGLALKLFLWIAGA